MPPTPRAAATQPAAAPPRAPEPSPRAAPLAGEQLLRYTEHSPVRVIGHATGRAYAFSAERPTQSVARADAQALLATRFFRVA